MARLKSQNTEPPGGWEYVQFETGARLRGENMDDIISKVVSHRAWKGIAPTDRESVRLDIERQICLGQEGYVCIPEPGEDYRPLRDLMRIPKMEAIMGFTRAAFNFIEEGGG